MNESPYVTGRVLAGMDICTVGHLPPSLENLRSAAANLLPTTEDEQRRSILTGYLDRLDEHFARQDATSEALDRVNQEDR